jgi:hypothetical protein
MARRATRLSWPLIVISIAETGTLPTTPFLMKAYAVSRAVNAVKNDTEECIQPIDDQPQ